MNRTIANILYGFGFCMIMHALKIEFLSSEWWWCIFGFGLITMDWHLEEKK